MRELISPGRVGLDMNTIKKLNWHVSSTFSGCFAELSKTEELRAVRDPAQGGLTKLVLVTRRAPDQPLGEFRTLIEAFDYATEWVGDL